MNQPFDNDFLNSLHTVFQKNPNDRSFKKYFALELYKAGQFKEAMPLLREVLAYDNDINVERAIHDIEEQSPKEETPMGFSLSPKEEASLENVRKQLVTFQDIAGMEGIKDAIRTDIIYPFQHPEVYTKYHKTAGGGILLFGPPGCGKTFIAKATAGEINAEFISVSLHEILAPWLGVGENTLHDIFESARHKAPAVLFFDEIDAVTMSRAQTGSALRPLVNQFLAELDGIGSKNDNMLILAATNLPWDIDPALRRPGRFDKVLFVQPPDKKARERIFELNLISKPHEEIDYIILAKMTKEYSSADIVRVCDEASEIAFKEAIRTGKDILITQESLIECIKKIKSSITTWFDTARNYIQYSNESGLFDGVKEYLENIKSEQ